VGERLQTARGKIPRRLSRLRGLEKPGAEFHRARANYGGAHCVAQRAGEIANARKAPRRLQGRGSEARPPARGTKIGSAIPPAASACRGRPLTSAQAGLVPAADL